jgi:hypothetical protein
VDVDSDKVDSIRSLDPELARIANDYVSGNITKRDYFNKLSVTHQRRSIELHKEYLMLQNERSELLQNVPVWSKLRYILSAVQFIAILVAILVYFLIYRSISIRTK